MMRVRGMMMLSAVLLRLMVVLPWHVDVFLFVLYFDLHRCLAPVMMCGACGVSKPARRGLVIILLHGGDCLVHNVPLQHMLLLPTLVPHCVDSVKP